MMLKREGGGPTQEDRPEKKFEAPQWALPFKEIGKVIWVSRPEHNSFEYTRDITIKLTGTGPEVIGSIPTAFFGNRNVTGQDFFLFNNTAINDDGEITLTYRKPLSDDHDFKQFVRSKGFKDVDAYYKDFRRKGTHQADDHAYNAFMHKLGRERLDKIAAIIDRA